MPHLFRQLDGPPSVWVENLDYSLDDSRRQQRRSWAAKQVSLLGMHLGSLLIAMVLAVGNVCQGAVSLVSSFNLQSYGTVSGGQTITDAVGNTQATLNNDANTSLTSSGLTISGGNSRNTGLNLAAGSLSGFTGSFSIQTWVTVQSGGGTILYAANNGPANGYIANGFDGYAAVYGFKWGSCLSGGGAGNATGTAYNRYGQTAGLAYSMTAGTLYDIVLTYDAGTHIFRQYVNGVQTGSQTNDFSQNSLAQAQNFTVGGGTATETWGDNSALSTTKSFRLYRGSLSSNQVASIYALGASASVASIQSLLPVEAAVVWTGAGPDNNWSTAGNWASTNAPAYNDSVVFAGSTQLTVNMDAGNSVSSLNFSNNAGSFNIGGGNTLTLAGGLTNNSASAQTINVPVSISTTQAINAAAGNLIFGQDINNNGKNVTFAGSGDITLNGMLTGSGGVVKTGSGTVTIRLPMAPPASYGGNTVIQSGTVRLLNDGFRLVTSTFSGAGNLTFANGGGVVGPMVLWGANNLTGTTTVSNGSLFVAYAPNQSLGSTISVRDYATLGVLARADTNYISPATLIIGNSAGATLQFGLRGISEPGLTGTNHAPIQAGAVTINGTATINIASCPFATNSYPLFTGYSSGTLALGSQPPGYLGKLTVSGGTVYYTVTNLDSHYGPFVHPGCMITQADIDRMKAKIAAGAEPWTSGYAVLTNNWHSSASYNANPYDYIRRGGANQNYTAIMNDAAAAYQCALRWRITGDTNFAEAAVRNMDGYSSTLISIGGSTDALLLLGAQGFDFACAAELMRNYQPWVDSGGFTRFQNFLIDKFYQSSVTGNGIGWFLQAHNGTCYSHYWLNWDGFALSAAAAFGVVCDRRDVYDFAVNYYKGSGAGNGMVTNALYFMHPGYLGQSQELGRDMGHASIDPVLLAQLCEVAWNQGDDLFGYDNNAVLAISEMTCRAMTADGVPWVNYAGCDATGTGPAGGSNYRAGLDMIWNHYVNIKGLSAPYTTAWALANRPEGGGGNYGGNSGGFDQIGFTTLTHALDASTNTSAPSALQADAPLANTARIWWWGSAYATGYNVKRATSIGGPYTLVATNLSAKDLLYTDTCLTPGTTYYYVVSAIINGVETTNSLPVSVTANQRLAGTVIGVDGTFTWGQGKEQLFDNCPRTWFDSSTASGAWAGLDLGIPHRITKVGYYPRANFPDLMTGGQFQGCNVADFSSGVVTLFTIGSQPADGTNTVQNISDTGSYRYVRYIGPNNSYCNAAEIQFEGYPQPAVAPFAPTNLEAVAGNASVTLNWSAPGDTTSFNVKRATVSGGPYTVIASGYTSAIYTDADVTNSVTYYYVVSASNATGESADSAEVFATPSANALAGNVVWSGASGSVWDTNTLNWVQSGSLVTYHEGDRVLFDDSSGPNTTVNLSAIRSPSAVTFNNGWRSYTLTGSAINCSGALVKNGGGALFIPGANTFAGGAILAGGRTTIQNINSLGTGSLTLAGGTLSTYGVMTLSKDITVTGAGGISLGSANDLTYTGTLTGSGWLTLGDDGNNNSLNLSGVNSLTGGTVAVANNNNYVRFKTTAMGSASTDWEFDNTSAGRTTIDFASGTIPFGSLAGNGVIQGNVGGAMNVTFLVGGNDNSANFTGIINNNPAGSGTISLTKVGAGMQRLTGACTYSGPTTVSSGGLVVSTLLAGKSTVSVAGGATLGVTNLSSGSGIISNLTLAAGTTLELMQVASTTTPLLVASNLAVNGSCTVKITQSQNQIFLGTYPLVNYAGSFQGAFANLQLQLPPGIGGTLVSNAHQIALTITNIPVPAAPVTLAATASGQQILLNWSSSVYATGYNVWRSTVSGGGYALLGSAVGTNFTDSGAVNNQTYYYVVTATNSFGSSGYSPEASATVGLTEIWTGATDTNWDYSTTNWAQLGTPILYRDDATVRFDDTALSNFVINISGTVSPTGVIVSNNANAYAFSGGAIGGTNGLLKQGGGTLTLNAVNTYSGETTISNGTIVCGNAGALGSGPLTMAGGTLVNSSAAQLNLSTSIYVFGTNAVYLSVGQNISLVGSTLYGNGTVTWGWGGGGWSSLWPPQINQMTGGTVIIPNTPNNFIRLDAPGCGNTNVDWIINESTSGHATLGFANGTLAFGSLSGSGILDNQNNAGNTLSVGGNNKSTTFSGNLINAAGLTLQKVGTGTLTLSGANTHVGPAAVNAGKLLLTTAWTGKGNFSVASGGALAVTNISSSSVLASNLTVAAGSALEFQIVSSTNVPLVTASNVIVNGACTIKIPYAAGFDVGKTYPLIKYSGQFYGSFADLQLQLPAGATGTLVNGANQIAVSITSVPAPAAPATLTAVGGPGQVALNWSAASFASSYNVKRSTTSGSGYVTIGTASGTSYTDTAVVPGQTYYYVVTATNSNGESGNSPEASAVPLSPLQAYLKFDESGSATTAVDATGHGWNGTLVNGPTWVAGYSSNAVNLSGSSQYVTLPAGVVSNLTDFTISAWVKQTSRVSQGRIFDFGTSAAPGANTGVYMFLTPYNGSSMRFAITTSGYNNEQGINVTALNAGVWAHVAVTLSGSTAVLYVNGVPAGTNSAMTLKPSSLGNTTQNYIGKSQFPDPYLNGQVDEFRIYNRALSPSEVATFVTPLAAPTGLAATAGDSQVALSWNAVTNAAYYQVLRSLTNGGSYTQITAVAATNYTDSAVLNGTNYYYIVKAANAASTSGNSTQVSARPVSTVPPTSSATLVGNQFRLSWPADHTGWRLQMNTNLAGTNWLEVPGANGTNVLSVPTTNGNMFYRLVYP